ncbi:MAG TPA: tetratricopeptide repeat protein [Actinocrinis sp.]|nr:tetratricopeptide repeat protein [Actinocrinis sp.]
MRPSFSTSGVVDLSVLKQPPARPGGDPAAGAAAAGGQAPAGVVVDVTEADFQQEVLERSTQVPVLVYLWADRDGQSAQFGPLLESLAAEYNGAFVLARVDAVRNQQLAMALRVERVPAVKVIVGGELIGEFAGVQPEPQMRRLIGDLLDLAEREFGMVPPPRADGEAADAEAEPPIDPVMAAAYDALAVDDLDGAAQALRSVLSDNPAHPEAKPALAQVELMRRTRDADPAAALAAAEADPQNLDARCLAADVRLATGDVDGAIAELLACVRSFAGPERDRARLLLLDYFELLGPDDPRVAKGRGRLAAALF